VHGLFDDLAGDAGAVLEDGDVGGEGGGQEEEGAQDPDRNGLDTPYFMQNTTKVNSKTGLKFAYFIKKAVSPLLAMLDVAGGGASPK